MGNKNHKILESKESNVKVEETSMNKEKAEYLNGNPTREEVMHFVDGYVNNQVLPYMINTYSDKINRLKGMLSMSHAIMINSGLITEEELTELINRWEKDYENEEKKKLNKISNSNLSVVK